MSTGQPIQLLPDEVVNNVQNTAPGDSHSRQERDELFFAAMMRVLDRELPGYAD
jgi:hypothetical protein